MTERILSLDEWAAVVLPSLFDEAIASGDRTPLTDILGDAFKVAKACVERSRRERDGRRSAVADDDGRTGTGG